MGISRKTEEVRDNEKRRETLYNANRSIGWLLLSLSFCRHLCVAVVVHFTRMVVVVVVVILIPPPILFAHCHRID